MRAQDVFYTLMVACVGMLAVVLFVDRTRFPRDCPACECNGVVASNGELQCGDLDAILNSDISKISRNDIVIALKCAHRMERDDVYEVVITYVLFARVDICGEIIDDKNMNTALHVAASKAQCRNADMLSFFCKNDLLRENAHGQKPHELAYSTRVPCVTYELALRFGQLTTTNNE
jgi:hypothetical protein